MVNLKEREMQGMYAYNCTVAPSCGRVASELTCVNAGIVFITSCFVCVTGHLKECSYCVF